MNAIMMLIRLNTQVKAEMAQALNIISSLNTLAFAPSPLPTVYSLAASGCSTQTPVKMFLGEKNRLRYGNEAVGTPTMKTTPGEGHE